MSNSAPRVQIYKRRERGTWRAKILLPDETQWRQKDGFVRKGDAESWVQDQIAAYHRGDLRPTVRTNLHDYVEDVFLPSLADREKRDRLARHWRLYLGPSIPTKTIVEDLDKSWVRRWFATDYLTMTEPGRNKPISLSYHRQIFWTFKQILDRLVDDDILLRSPLPDEVRPATAQPGRIKYVLEPLEIEKLASGIARFATRTRPGRRAADLELWGLENHTLIFTMAYAGTRIGEVLGLRVNDLRVKDRGSGAGFLVVDEQNQDGHLGHKLKQGRSQRSIPVNGELMRMLAEFCDRAGRSGDDLIFYNPLTGGTLIDSNWRKDVFHPGAESAGFPSDLRPHHLRHTAASAWFDEGWDIEMVALFLGDSVRVAREIYVHVSESKMLDGIERMGERLRRGRAAWAALCEAETVEPAKIVSLEARRSRRTG